jgi:hypothetical protein
VTTLRRHCSAGERSSETEEERERGKKGRRRTA